MQQKPFAQGNNSRQRQHRTGRKEGEADAARLFVKQYRLRRNGGYDEDADAHSRHRSEKQQQQRAVKRKGDPGRHRDAEKRTADQRAPDVEFFHHDAAERTAEQHHQVKDTEKKPYGLRGSPHFFVKRTEEKINIGDTGDAVVCQEYQDYLAAVLHRTSSCL